LIKDYPKTEIHHHYKLPFDEFWNIIKDNKLISKDLFYSPMFSHHSLEITMDIGGIEQIAKRLKIKGGIQGITTDKKKDIVEITSSEYIE